MSRSRFGIWILVAVVSAVALCIFLWRAQPESISASPQPSSEARQQTLSLQVEKQNDGLRLSWDRQAQAVREAQHAVVSILDGDDRRQITLDAAQLATGSIVYWPAHNQVNFRMELSVGGSTVKESVWSIDNTPGQSAASPAPPAPGPRATKAPRAFRSGSVRAGPAAQAAKVPAPRESARPQPATLASKPNVAAAPVTAPPIVTERHEPPVPPVAAHVPAPAETDVEQPASPFVSVTAEPAKGSLVGRVVGKIPLLKRVRGKPEFPPSPIRQTMPVVPEHLKRRVRGEIPIDVKVYVTDTGKVEFAELLSEGTGSARELASLAVYAARRWEFHPARSGDRTVPGEVILHFRFGNESVAQR